MSPRERIEQVSAEQTERGATSVEPHGCCWSFSCFPWAFAWAVGTWAKAFNPSFEKRWNLPILHFGRCPGSGRCAALKGIPPCLTLNLFDFEEKKVFSGWTPCCPGTRAGSWGGGAAFCYALLKELYLDWIQGLMRKNSQMIFKNERKSKLSAQAAENEAAVVFEYSVLLCVRSSFKGRDWNCPISNVCIWIKSI